MSARADLYSDIRHHADRAGGKFLHENVVLQAVEEILDSQGLTRTPVAYLGALMMSLQAEDGRTEPATYAGMLTLLDRALSAENVPRAVVISKAPRISAALVAVANAHAEHPPVLKGALACVLRLLAAQPTGAPPSSDNLKLFHWLLGFVVHPSPKVRARGHLACTAALEQCPGLSDATSRFVEQRLAATAMTDVQPALYVLGFLRKGLGAMRAKSLGNTAQAMLRLPSLGHPLLSKTACEVIIAMCTCEAGNDPLGAPLLSTICERMLASATEAAEAAPATKKRSAESVGFDPHALRAAAAAATALLDADAPSCHALLPSLVTAWIKSLWREHSDGASGGGSSSGAPGDEFHLKASELKELLGGCVRPSMAPAAATALSSALVDALGPRYLPLREGVLEACSELYLGLGEKASPACDELLRGIADMYSDATIGALRPMLLASLGHAAKAIGPERFITLLPIKISTDGGLDTSWLLSALRHHIGRAKMAFFGSYFLPLTQWIETRAGELEKEPYRQIEARNLRNLYEQVWALLPGFASCARDVAEALPSIARLMGVALAERPEVRQHVLHALTLMVNTARSRKEPKVDASGGVTLSLTEDATAALETVGRFGKNFLPLLFNVHQAEPAEKRALIHEAVGAVASVTPEATLTDLFKTMLRRLLEPSASAEDGPTAEVVETQRGLLDLLISLSPSLGEAQVGLLARGVKPLLLAADVLLQKKAYKVLGSIAAHHPPWVRAEVATLLESLTEALPACAPGCKGKRLACLQAVASALPEGQLQETLPVLLGEVVLATKEINIKTRAAAFEFLVGLAASSERRAAGGDGPKANALRNIIVMVAGGLAGNSPHMMAATLSALGRLTFELRGRPLLEPTIVQLFATVLQLLAHNAQEVVKAAISYVKVGLYALSIDAVRPLLPQLVPPMLTWCSNKHPHLKTQVRYVMERLVKRFGHDEMVAVTPEAHQKLLVHLRKQKVRSHNHALARRQERDERRAMSLGDDAYADAAEATARRERHADRGSKADMAMRATWMDASEDAAGVDLLSAPLVPAAGKRRRDGRDGSAAREYSANYGGVSRARGTASSAAADDDGGVVRLDDEGKLVVLGGDSKAAADERIGETMEVDPEHDEIIRPGKKRRTVGNMVVPASKAEEAETEQLAAAARAAKKAGGGVDERHKRKVKLSRGGPDNFGANFGDAFKGKKGAAGDVTRKGGTGVQPYAYLPLNPRMLGKKQQKMATETMTKLLGPAAKGKAKGVAKQGRVGKHGIQARRHKNSSARK